MYHSCKIIYKYNLLTFDDFFFILANVTLVYKILHSLAPPPLKQLIVHNTYATVMTRSATRGECYIKYRSTAFARSAFKVKPVEYWNSLPTAIRECGTLKTFKSGVKTKQNKMAEGKTVL